MIKTPALLNPLRWIDTTNINNSFDGNFFKDQLRWDQTYRGYFQPFQTSDFLVQQVIADALPPNLEIVDCNNLIVASVLWTQVPLILLGLPGLNIYELSYSFNALPIGKYYCSFDIYTSEPIDVQIEHINTMLIKYKNIQNNYDVVFDTSIEFQFRVESAIGNYTPKNDRSVYFDQTKNATQLNSVAYRKFTYFVGKSYGVPNWVLDKVNIITQCDQLKLNDVPYQILPDAEFEVENNEDNDYIGGQIDIEPVTNNFLRYQTSGNLNPTLTFTPVQKINQYLNIGADFFVSGFFKNRSLLEKISISKRSSPALTLNIGTAVNGSQIGSFLVNQTEITYTVEELFNNAVNVYLSGLAGSDVDIWLIWKQLDEPPINLTPSTGGVGKLMRGFRATWTEIIAGDFGIYWDVATGLGKANTNAFGWCIAGSNGTDAVDDAYMVGAKFTDFAFDQATLGTIIGSNNKIITKPQLPATGINLFSDAVNGTPNDIPGPSDKVARARSAGNAALNYEIVKGNGGTINIGISGNLGSGADFNVQPKSLVTIWIVKLEDD